MAFFSQNADLMSGFQTSKLPEMDEDNHSDALVREVVMHSGRFWKNIVQKWQKVIIFISSQVKKGIQFQIWLLVIVKAKFP